MLAVNGNVSELSARLNTVEKECNDSHTWLTNRIDEMQNSIDLLSSNTTKFASQLICKGIPKSESNCQ